MFDSYQVIEQQAMVHLANAYDMVLGYSWPGGDQKLDWWQAKKRANAVARMFRFLLDSLAGDAGAVDVMSHSLGARVTLKALKGSPGRIVRNYFCTAPAVDNECFESDEEFADAIPSCERVYIFHSSRDEVLRFAYASSERDLALGLYGPEDKTYIEVATRTVFVANCKKVVSNHGGARRRCTTTSRPASPVACSASSPCESSPQNRSSARPQAARAGRDGAGSATTGWASARRAANPAARSARVLTASARRCGRPQTSTRCLARVMPV